MLPITRATACSFCRVCLVELKNFAPKKEPPSDLNENVKLRKCLCNTTDTYPDHTICVGEAYPRWLCFTCSSKAQTFNEFRIRTTCCSVALSQLLEEGEMRETTLQNLQRFCRICLKQHKTHTGLMDTSDVEMRDWLLQCTKVSLASDTPICPKYLCNRCYKTLRNFMEYRRVAKQSYDYLKNVLGDEWERDNARAKEFEVVEMEVVEEKEPKKTENSVEPEGGIFVDQLPVLNVNSICNDDDELKDEIVIESHDTSPTANKDTPANDKTHESEAEGELKKLEQKEIVTKTRKPTKRECKKQKLPAKDKTLEPKEKLSRQTKRSEEENETDSAVPPSTSPHATTPNKEVDDGNKLIEKSEEKTRKGTIKCECGKNFRKQLLYEAHVRCKHKGIETPFQCEQCPNSYRHYHYLRRHMNEKHCEPLAVETDGEGSPDGDAAGKTGFGSISYACGICLKSFKRKDHLAQHLRAVHERSRPYKCQYCEKTFGAKKTLRVHEMGHTGEKPYKCTMCSKCFRQANDLHRHMDQHTTNPELLCPICKRGKSNAEELEEHIRTHKTSYQCETCGKVFKKHSTWREHDETVHQRLALYACPHCDEKFVFRRTYRRHVDNHTTPAKVKTPDELCCSVCKQIFKKPGGLGRHMKKHDKTNVIETKANT